MNDKKKEIQKLQQLIDSFTEDLKINGFHAQVKGPIESEEVCICENCLTFDNFEESLGKEEGVLDFAEVVLNKKNFKIKYYDGPLGELMRMREVPFEVPKNWTGTVIQLELNRAVTEKNFDMAQILLTELVNRKNKN
jgi:hypothetical protein